MSKREAETLATSFVLALVCGVALVVTWGELVRFTCAVVITILVALCMMMLAEQGGD